jgi:hypothetical protein
LVDNTWFEAQLWPDLQRWIERFLASTQFDAVVLIYPKWVDGDPPVMFPQSHRSGALATGEGSPLGVTGGR